MSIIEIKRVSNVPTKNQVRYWAGRQVYYEDAGGSYLVDVFDHRKFYKPHNCVESVGWEELIDNDTHPLNNPEMEWFLDQLLVEKISR